MPPHKHQELMTAAVERDGEAQRALLSRDRAAARTAFAEAAELYRQSWEVAPDTAYGRLVGMLKSAVLGGGGTAEAEFARRTLGDRDPDSVTASYAQALAALIVGEEGEAEAWAARMSAGNEAFARTAEAIRALAAHDGARYEAALATIVGDFEQRAQHLTGVAIADTALMLAELGRRRGMSMDIQSPVLPAP